MKKGFTLIELLVVIAIIGLLASVVLVSLNTARAKARDAKRQAELNQVQLAIEMYYNQTGSYVTGTFFSVWDSNYGHTVNYWSGGNPPWSTAFYDSLVGNNYLGQLPLDPVNREGGSGNYLGDGPSTDQGYVYWSDNGQRYILGTNLETSGDPVINSWGNYQIKGGNW
jgi:prepilin-type N-terminal cleavage/methylation domain-containing protein